MFVLRISGSRKPCIASKNDRIDGAVLGIDYIGKRADSLLILKDGNTGKQLGFVSHAEASNECLRTSTAKSLTDRPFDESIGKDKSAVSAEKEVDDKLPQPWLVCNLHRPKPPAVPGLKPECGDDRICGPNALGGLVQFGKESVAERLECLISQA